MESAKTVCVIIGALLILISIICFGFLADVREIIHDDEITQTYGIVTDVHQESVYHHRKHGRGYTTYITTLTLNVNSEIVTVTENSLSRTEYYKPVGTKMTVFEWNGNYALSRHRLFLSTASQAIGTFIGIIGVSFVIVPLVATNRRRW